MRKTWIRRLVGAAALLAACWIGVALTEPAADAKDPLPDGMGQKVIDSDVAFLEKTLAKKPAANAIRTIKTTAMLIALTAQNSMDGPDKAKMAVVRSKRLAMAEASKVRGGKFADADYMAVKKALEELKAAKPDPAADTKPLKLHEMHDVDLEMIMSSGFKAPAALKRDYETAIMDMAKKKAPLDVKVAWEASTRAVLIGTMTMELANDKAKANPANQKRWEQMMQDMIKAGQETAAEAAKGDKADKNLLQKKIASLDASCSACHDAFKN